MKLIELANKYRNEFVATVAATTSVFMVVSSKAWTSPALPKLMADDSPVPISPDEGSWLVSIIAFGGIFGPIITAGVIDRFGRKLALLSSVIPVAIGWVLIGLGDSVVYLYIARFLFGAAYGTVYTVCPIYIGEISSDAIRGSAGTMMTLLAKLAYMFTYSVGPYVEYRTLAWISMIGPALFFLCVLWMPETPYYLLGKSKDKQAEKSLVWLRRSSVVSEQLAAMKALSVERSNEEKRSIKELFLPMYRKNMGITFILVFCMQFSGLFSILGYAQTIFEMTPTNMKPEEMSIVLGAVQLLAVLFPVLLVDRMGRRPLLLLSSGGSILGLLTCSVCFAFSKDGASQTLGWLAFVSLLFFIVSYGIGLATVPFAILSEIFPKDIKAYANVTFTVSSAILTIGITKMFQKTLDSGAPYLPFGIFAACGAVGWVLIYFYVPETKGKSLEEIQRILKGDEEASK